MPDENENPIAQMLNLLEKRAKAEQVVMSRSELERDKCLQKLRVELNAMVDDPTHPFTEGHYAKTFCAYVTMSDALGEAMANCPSARAGAIVMRITAERMLLTAKHLEESANGCNCPDCAS